MKFCFNCGEKLISKVNYCPECGQNIERPILKDNTGKQNETIKNPLEVKDNVNLNENLIKPYRTDNKELFIATELDTSKKLKYGFINAKGEWVIQPMFDEVYPFREDDLTQAGINGKFGFINKNGEWVIQPMFDEVFLFREDDLAAAVLNEKHGLINRTGEWVIQPMFDNYIEFDEDGVAGAIMKGKHGLINRKGEWVVAPIFDEIGYFDEDRVAKAEINGKHGVINKKGEWIIQPIYDELDFHEDINNKIIVVVDENKKYGAINRKGDWIIQPILEEIRYGSFKNGCFNAKLNDKWGVFNENGEWLIQPKFELIQYYGFDEKKYLTVLYKNKLGWVDMKGEWIINAQFEYDDIWGEDFLTSFDSNDIAIIKNKNSLYGLINRQGEWVVNTKFDDIYSFDDKSLYIVLTNNKYGIIDKKGDWVVQPKFSKIEWLVDNNENINVEIEGKKGLINRKGEWVIRPNYYLLERFDTFSELGLVYKASKDNKYGFVDKNGDWIIHPKFDYFLTDLYGDNMIWNIHTSNWEMKVEDSNDNKYEDNEDDYALAESVERYFYELQNIESLYLNDNLPNKKIQNFIKHFNSDFFNQDGKILVYFDATVWGKGDNGFLIYRDEVGRLYLFVNFYLEDNLCLCFENDGTNDILIDSLFVDKKTLSLLYVDQEGNEKNIDNYSNNKSFIALNNFINDHL